jgi:hypothetical protein
MHHFVVFRAATLAASRGGLIVANASGNATLTLTAVLNASGRAGGGTVAAGTMLARAAGRSGLAAMPAAANVLVQKGATIAADANGKGNGGRVAVLSNNATAMAGSISAKGGRQGGDGGSVETSGQSVSIGNNAIVNASAQAPIGVSGTWLIDPHDLQAVGGTAGTSQISNATINSALAKRHRGSDHRQDGWVRFWYHR